MEGIVLEEALNLSSDRLLDDDDDDDEVTDTDVVVCDNFIISPADLIFTFMYILKY